MTPVVQAATLRHWGARLPWAWPRDGRRETLEGAGQALAQQYRKEGLELLHQHAQFEDGGVSVEAGLMDMLIRMESGRFKVFSHLNDWWEEFRLYHRKDGKVYKENDDLMRHPLCDHDVEICCNNRAAAGGVASAVTIEAAGWPREGDARILHPSGPAIMCLAPHR